MRNGINVVAISGLVLVGALIVVGVVSGGIVRHIIQTGPVLVASFLVLRGAASAAWGAVAAFLVWLFIMTCIWLFLLGIARVITGHYSPTEIAMTVVVAIAAVIGIVAALRARRETTFIRGLCFFVLFAVLQVAALWLSFQPHFSNDHNFALWISRAT
jgi:hypothetical protein